MRGSEAGIYDDPRKLDTWTTQFSLHSLLLNRPGHSNVESERHRSGHGSFCRH